MYMPRKIDKFLADWKSEQNRKPLIVKGSRQVGKTESIRHFAAGTLPLTIMTALLRLILLKSRNTR